MAKSKNHTNHNQNQKAHRNGIHRPKKSEYLSMRGVDRKVVRNLRKSRKNNEKSGKNLRRIEHRGVVAANWAKIVAARPVVKN